MAKIKLLLADHNIVDREGLRCLLEKETDIDIIGETADGEETLNIIKSKKPDVVLLDISMPTLNGIGAIKTIKEASFKTEVVILTGSHKKTNIRDALQFGASGYLLKTGTLKTGTFSDLLTAIRSAKEQKYFLSPEISSDIIETYLGRDATASKGNGYEQLTKSEKPIFRMIAEGYTTDEVAERLSISPKTVAKHRMNIMEKLEIKNVAKLVRYAE